MLGELSVACRDCIASWAAEARGRLDFIARSLLRLLHRLLAPQVLGDDRNRGHRWPRRLTHARHDIRPALWRALGRRRRLPAWRRSPRCLCPSAGASCRCGEAWFWKLEEHTTFEGELRSTCRTRCRARLGAARTIPPRARVHQAVRGHGVFLEFPF